MSQRPAHKRMCSTRLWLALFLALLIFMLRSLLGSLSFSLPKSQEESRETSEKKNTDTVVFTLHPKYNLTSEVSTQAAPGKRSLLLLEHDLKRLRKRATAARHSHARMLITPILSLMFPVQGNIIPNGLYYVAMQVGNPGKAYYFDMDTGSDLTWLQCDAPCRNCGKVPNGLYDPKKGGRVVDCRHAFCAKVQRGGSYPCEEMSNRRWPQCDYEREFVDGAATMGLLMNDVATLLFSNGTRIRTTVIVGCGYDQRGSLAQDPQPTDGVMGLSSSTAALPSQLVQKGIIKNNVIGHCLAGGSNTRSFLFFGDALVPTSGMTWVPMIGRPGMEGYQAHVLSIHYGSDELKNGNKNIGGRVTFDSGTSFTYLVPEAYTTVLSAVQDQAKSRLTRLSTDTTLPYCWGGPFPFKSVANVQQYFKTITFNFDGSRTLELFPEGYLVLSMKGNICFGILAAKGASLETLNIIGDISMRGYLLVYDNVREQIGWVRNNCQSRPIS